MADAMRELGAPEPEVSGLAEALPSWEPFPEVGPALESARARGWKLAILSNTDRDFIEASLERIDTGSNSALREDSSKASRSSSQDRAEHRPGAGSTAG